MDDCHIGGLPIVGAVWPVNDYESGRVVSFCELHARTHSFGKYLFDELGVDDPLFQANQPGLEQIMRSPCLQAVDTPEPELVIDDETRRLLDKHAPFTVGGS